MEIKKLIENLAGITTNKMTTKIKGYISYHVTENGGSGWNYDTLKKAKDQLKQMSLGFPKNTHMTDANREYWIGASKRHFIEKHTKTVERL